MNSRALLLLPVAICAAFLATAFLLLSPAASSQAQACQPNCDLAEGTDKGSDLIIESDSPRLVGEEMNFEATVEGAPPFTYTWNFDDGSDPDTGIAPDSPLAASHIYWAAGSYSVTLVVTDATPVVFRGSDWAEVECYLITVDLTNSGPVGADQPVDLTADIAGGHPRYYYTWYFGDGSDPVTGTTLESALAEMHQYAAGTYIATLQIIDRYGCSALQVETTVEVHPAIRYLPLVLNSYSPPLPTSPVVNGGFETGDLSDWDSGGELPTGAVTTLYQGDVYSDTYSALLGNPDYGDGQSGNVPVGSAWITQVVTMTPGYTGTLSLAYRLQGWDGLNNDRFRACARNADNLSEEICFEASFPGYAGSFKDTDWVEATLDIPFAWRTVQIYLDHANEIDGYYNTWTYVDEVQILYSR